MKTWIRARTLRWVNRQRAAIGLEPRENLASGQVSEPATCPVRNSISYAGEIRVFLFHWVDHRGLHMLPPYVTAFIVLFDRYAYRDLRAGLRSVRIEAEFRITGLPTTGALTETVNLPPPSAEDRQAILAEVEDIIENVETEDCGAATPAA